MYIRLFTGQIMKGVTMLCFINRTSKFFAFFLWLFLLVLFCGCQNRPLTDLPKTKTRTGVQRFVKRIKFGLIVDTPFIFQNKLYLSAIEDPEKDSFYNLLLEYDLKTNKQRIVANSFYFPGNIQMIRANNRWLVYCDGRAEVGPEKLIVIDLKKGKKKVFYEAHDEGVNKFKTVDSLTLYQNYLAFGVNGHIRLIDLKKEKAVFQRKLKLEPGEAIKGFSFDQGNLFWSEKEGDKLVFYFYQPDSGKTKKFSLPVAKKSSHYGFTQAKNGLIYFAEFPYLESRLYELKCFDPKTGEVLAIDKNCGHKFSLFEGGVLYSVKTQKGDILKIYYSRGEKKVELNIKDFSKTLAELDPLPIAYENYFLAVEPLFGPTKNKKKRETILYIVNLNRYR